MILQSDMNNIPKINNMTIKKLVKRKNLINHNNS